MAATTHSNGEVNYINEFKGIKSWLTSLDHKRIGLLYMIAVLFFFLVFLPRGF